VVKPANVVPLDIPKALKEGDTPKASEGRGHSKGEEGSGRQRGAVQLDAGISEAAVQGRGPEPTEADAEPDALLASGVSQA
jgi:hypothetical protein